MRGSKKKILLNLFRKWRKNLYMVDMEWMGLMKRIKSKLEMKEFYKNKFKNKRKKK